jgi:hypothetical protein
MNYQITSLQLSDFNHLFGLDEQALAEKGVQRMTVTAKPGYPCRITLEDAEVGETVLLLNYEHLSVNSPYRSAHALFVRENATDSASFENEIPKYLGNRQLSVRSFDTSGMMVDADTCEGKDLESLVERLLGDELVDFLHVHNAARGCYLARVDRN